MMESAEQMPHFTQTIKCVKSVLSICSSKDGVSIVLCSSRQAADDDAI